ncbi:MAG: ribonuclease III [Albidovulum sp.]|nr:ribonuclease III [Albidovulum sp.]MDE0531918.1 ribonuclease III [Albidovulum sp.]
MKLSREIRELESRLGYAFSNSELIASALTHRSRNTRSAKDNDRLEFLGDRVLGLVIAEALIQRDPDAAAGVLAPRYNALVGGPACAEVARDLGVGAAIKLGRSESMSGGRRKSPILADMLEAVLGAVYLDGGFAAARDLILRLWADRIRQVDEDARDAKSILQEYAQACGQALPEYSELSRAGPDHDVEFTMRVRLETGLSETASARTKRSAEMKAAKKLLDKIDWSENG